MATDFDSNAIVTAGGIKPSCVDTPGDMRTRVKLLEDIMTIPLPYVGMIVYCEETDCYYKITELGPKYIGNKEIENSLVEAYEEYDINMIVRNINNTYARLKNPEFTGYVTIGSRYTGTGNKGEGINSFTIGYYNEASSSYSFAQGYYCDAYGIYSFAQGDHCIASGESSHAEGDHTKASGAHSHAEGYNSIASNSSTHAEGYYAKASGKYSHAQNYYCTAGGDASHAEGNYTQTTAYAAHAEGDHTIANCPQQHVQGRYNIVDEDNQYAHIIGNGDSNVCSNAHTVDWNGNAWYAGDVYVGADNNKLATEKQINELMAIIESLQARIEELENK